MTMQPSRLIAVTPTLHQSAAVASPLGLLPSVFAFEMESHAMIAPGTLVSGPHMKRPHTARTIAIMLLVSFELE